MTSHASTLHLEGLVHRAISSIDDPEYPGVSIVELGLLESIDIDARGDVEVGLIPTFSGCPALAVIATEVTEAVAAIDAVQSCTVNWLAAPVWHTDRISHEARASLGDKFTVAVQLGQRTPTCPLCSSPTTEQSLFGPSRCRSVHTCSGCGETVEVMRG